MQMSLKDWRAFVKKLSAVNNKAASEVKRYIADNGLTDVQALINFCFGILEKYGNASAALSALMYDTIAELESVAVPAAELAKTATYADVAESVNGTLKISQNPDSIAGAVSRLVKLAGQDTFLQNAQRDGAEFAWIPSGDSCPFCLMLASRGWEKVGKGTMKDGHATHVHSNCDCTYMVRHSSSFNVSGYDPDRLYNTYRSADGVTWKDKINTLRREQYKEDAPKIRVQKREAYALRKEAEDNQAP